MAAASLSDEEFQRMQMQLLELRTKNYTLGEKNCKIQTELLQNAQQMEELRKELARSQKALARCKNARELVQEKERLQAKLQMQEDEFRLQNETLLQEVSALVAEKEQARRELELARAQRGPEPDAELRAQNRALLKMLQGGEERGGEELELQTLIEEKAVAQEDARRLQAECLRLQAESEKLCEKLRKKQESLVQLQNEKERMYEESRLAREKDAQIELLREEMRSGGEQQEATVELIAGERAAFECPPSLQERAQALEAQLRDSEEARRDLERGGEELRAALHELEALRRQLEESLAEKSRLAEKRKNLMDEMNGHLLETTNKHSQEIENLTRQLADEQEALQRLYDKEKETELKLLDARNEAQKLREENERLRACRSGFDARLKELEEALARAGEEHERRLECREREHGEAADALRSDYESRLEDLRVQVEVARAEKAEFEEKVAALQQEAKDSVDERRIQEKKGVAMVKELKRQLQGERGRAEKLQERLQEVLNEQNRGVVDEMLNASAKGDASSTGSWSYVSAERDNNNGAGPHSDTSSTTGRESPSGPTLLETETSSLIEKLTRLQQRNWMLEERVNHLEMSNAALVDDVLKKTALIQFYCMEGAGRPEPSSTAAQGDRLTLKRVVDFIKDKGDENLKEMNRRMQRMLEETLTKNMHLQRDIETLSDEVARLSKMSVDNGLQSAVFVESA